MDALTGRVIRAAGTPESIWLPWLSGQNIRRRPLDDLCAGGGRLVVVAPHPDDEILACGGLLRLRAERDLPSLMIAVTNGEASHGIAGSLSSPALGERRTGESYSGLRSLGVSSPAALRLGIPDGQVNAHVMQLADELRAILTPDDLVVSTWRLDGHPDHEATSAAANLACINAQCVLLQAPVWMWHWATPGDPRVPWDQLFALDLPEEVVTAKRHALSHHRSQLEERDGGLGPVLVSSIVERASRPQEYFFI